MKFKIIYQNGKEKYITAKNLEEAEKKADKKLKTWTDIYIVKNRKK